MHVFPLHRRGGACPSLLLYKENHWLGQWFGKAYGDKEKALLE